MDTIALINVGAQRDDAYRAIGRYTVLFSMLVAGMRQITARRIAGREGTERELIDLAFGGLTAEPIASAFFGMCRAIAKLDAQDQVIEKRLRTHVLDAIKMRNDIAHGDWLIAEWVVGRKATPNPKLVRVKASKLDAPFDRRELEVSELDEICSQMETLGNVVWEFGAICTGRYALNHFGPRRVQDALLINDSGRVVHKPGLQRMPPSYEM